VAGGEKNESAGKGVNRGELCKELEIASA
jgi:hypothetical protein